MPKRSIYFSEDDATIWDRLPEGMRSRLLRDLLIEHEFEEESKTDLDKQREMLKRQIIETRRLYVIADEKERNWESQMYSLECKKDELINEYEKIFGDFSASEIPINPAEIMDTIIAQAEYYSQKAIVFTSPSGTSRYRIQGVKKGKVMVERMDTASPKPSTFTVRTIEKAVGRLNQAGGNKIRRGHFMPVVAQEYAAVELHPNLSYLDGGEWLYFEIDRDQRDSSEA